MATIEVSGKQIYYEIHGQGQPLMILNGIMMSTKSWHMFLKDFKDFQVILMDFIDQGQSDSADTSYTHQVQVEAVLALIDHLGLKEITLAGISYGSEIALQVALADQKRLKQLIIFNGAAKTSFWLKDIGIAWQLAARTNNGNLFYHVAIPYIYSSGFYSDNEQWFKDRKDELLTVFTPDFLNRMDRLIASSEDYDIINRLKEIDIPVTVVSADQDFITPPHESMILIKGLKDVRAIPLADCGHASMYEKPDRFAEIIRVNADSRPLVRS